MSCRPQDHGPCLPNRRSASTRISPGCRRRSRSSGRRLRASRIPTRRRVTGDSPRSNACCARTSTRSPARSRATSGTARTTRRSCSRSFPASRRPRTRRRHLRRWMKPERRGVSLWFQPGRARIFAQPLGVAGIVVPWNYPIYLAAGPLVAALAAGNRVMIKMSELAPATGALLAALVAGSFARDEVCVVNGEAEVGRAFSALPFDHLLFTGSTAVGRGGDARRRGEPDAGHARARRQVAGDRRRRAIRLAAAAERIMVRQADERRTDVHRAGLRAGAGGGGRRLRRRGAAGRRRMLRRIRCARPTTRRSSTPAISGG